MSYEGMTAQLVRDNEALQEQIDALRAENEELKARCCRYAEEAMHYEELAEERAGLPTSVVEALNSGDGVYRP